jgi:hypothetical protein
VNQQKQAVTQQKQAAKTALKQWGGKLGSRNKQ